MSQMRETKYVEIVGEDEVRPWQYTNPDTRETYASIFHLRIIDKDREREIKRRHTKMTFIRGVRTEETNWDAFTDDCLDYAIAGWEQVKAKGEDLPCERKYKLGLPAAIKADILRLSLGKELGEVEVSEEAREADTGDGEAGEGQASSSSSPFGTPSSPRSGR